MHPDDLPRLEMLLARPDFTTGEHVDVRLRHADGEDRWCRLHVHTSGQPDEWHVSATDIHDLKHHQ